MALETGIYISDLVPTNPLGSDPLAFADDHTRLIKATIKNTFPNITGAVTVTHTNLNNAVQKDGTVAMTGPLTLSGNATSDLHAVPRQQVVSLAQALYPVGSIYINSTNATNPATLLGFGTWVAFGSGRVPVGVGGTYTAGDMGGSADAIVVSHTHTATSVVTDPGHFHQINAVNEVLSGGSSSTLRPQAGGNNTTTNTTGVKVATTNALAGTSGTNANLQPYIVVYMWNRTA